jgi:hypothetical protein
MLFIGIAAKQRVYVISRGTKWREESLDMLELLMFHAQMTIYPLRKS